MLKRLFSIMAAVLIAAGSAPAALAALADLGDSIDPHGYPAWYQDAVGLQLELCVPPPAGNATRQDLCIFDPLELDAEGNPVNPLVLTGESFYWMAMSSMAMPSGGDASVELAVEATFGGNEAAVDGQQITFGRTRIRIDTPVAGTYTVTHPFATEEFVVADAAEGINVTVDIGSSNFLFPELAFRGTLTAFGPDQVPFLTWPDYRNNPDLQVLEVDPVTNEPTGNVLEQYIGDPNIASPIVGGPNGNLFRVQGPEFNGVPIDIQTDLFFIMGKEFDSNATLVAHVFPDSPTPNLFAVGPVNREAFFAIPSTGEVTGVEYLGYPLGYPLWYQEAVPVLDPTTGEPVVDETTGLPQVEGGLQLTLCPPSDPMCIADPIDPTNPDMVALRSGGENFWFIAEAPIDIDANNRALVTLAVEATFGGTEAITDGNQIAFGRERIRVDTPVAGTYRITHPYGVRIFENVPADDNGINMTSDIGIMDPADPDGGFAGALYSDIGPAFLTWASFDQDPTLTDPRLVKPNAADPSLSNYYIGDPAILETVTGSPFGTNFFRIERLEGEDWVLVGETDQFFVAGKIFDLATFESAVNPQAPVALNDAATLDLALSASVTVDVLANDTFDATAPVTIEILPAGEAFGPEGGTVTINDNGTATPTVTYTPNAAFSATGGTDTFAYRITDSTGIVSANAIVTITVIPVETITIDRARFDTRKLRLDLAGTSNFEGSVLTIHAGSTAAGEVLGTAVVSDGGWSFRGTATANLTSVTVVSNSSVATSRTQSLQIR